MSSEPGDPRADLSFSIFSLSAALLLPGLLLFLLGFSEWSFDLDTTWHERVNNKK